jgi:pyruvate formate lyase activating enzyme
MKSGLILNIQRYSIHDGPGIRTTVFFKGCPLHCWWCHNPESQSSTPQVRVASQRCIRCGDCLEVCPAETTETPEPGQLPLSACLLCGACVAVCPTKACQIVGQTMTVDEVMAEIQQDRVFYDDSGGGVTFSGGEPLQQVSFLRALLQACRAEEIHTAVDTCGFAPREDLLTVASLTDLFLYDLKTMDEASHREGTGVSNKRILNNLKALGKVHDNIWIRVPIIPGWNDSDDQLENAARFAASVAGVKQVNLLPYHPLGCHKEDRDPSGDGRGQVEPPRSERMNRAAEKFRAAGLTTRIGG